MESKNKMKIEPSEEILRSKKLKWFLWIAAMLVLLLLVIMVSLIFGPSGITPGQVIRVFEGKEGSAAASIVFQIRLPRMVLALAIGGALAVSGVIFQGLFQNPLVEPYTLGISGGAALGVSICIILGLKNILGYYILPLSGFIGAALSLLVIYTLSVKKGIIKTNKLLLIGVMISFISSSLIILILALSEKEKFYEIFFWTMGSLEESNWFLINTAVWISLAGLLISGFFWQELNALSLGEENAVHLGLKVEKSKFFLLILSSILTGVSVSLAGIISFVGLVVPHLMRNFAGNDHRILLISSYIFGAIFLILCDTMARVIVAPSELPVGVITGIVGGVLFIYTLMKTKNFYV
jgi:iron complex transport system permease protein